uniref:Uncharacterized protein n=1 Tax=Arundo donax TaxID=35708 RepID=A0A0A9A9I3_ARUDO
MVAGAGRCACAGLDWLV